MALQLTKELPSGVSGDYIRVVGIQMANDSEHGVITIGLYKDQTAREASKATMLVEHIRVPKDGYPFTLAAMDTRNPIAISYNYLKTLPAFRDAVDV